MTHILILSLLSMSPRKTLPEKPFSLGIFVSIYFTDGSLCLLHSPFAAINDYPASFLVQPASLQFLRAFPASTQKWKQRTGINSCTLFFCQNIKAEEALVDPFRHTLVTSLGVGIFGGKQYSGAFFRITRILVETFFSKNIYVVHIYMARLSLCTFNHTY